MVKQLSGNARRARFGEDAVRQSPDYEYNDEAASLADTLANLMHWSDRQGINFLEAYSQACDHYQYETLNPEGV